MCRYPIQIAVTGVALVMVYVDQQLSSSNATPDFPQAFETGRVRSDYAIELLAWLGLLEQVVGVEEFIFLRNGIFVPANRLLALIAQGQGDTQLGADAVAIRADMANHAKGAATAQFLDDFIDDFGMGLHGKGRGAAGVPVWGS